MDVIRTYIESFLKSKVRAIYTLLSICIVVYFMWHHFMFKSWDFIVYMQNAQHFLNSGLYFELGRPPLISWILAFFHFIVSWNFAGYLYITTIATLFCYATYKLSRELQYNPLIFLIISASPFLLIEGLFNGTELLTYVCLQIACILLIKKSSLSGLALGLAGLAHYTTILLAPLVIVLADIKKITKATILFFIPWGFWFYWNFINYGNMFASIADQYALNILHRSYTIQPVNYAHFLEVLGLTFPLALLGFAIVATSLVLEGVKLCKKIEYRMHTKKMLAKNRDLVSQFLTQHNEKILFIAIAIIITYKYVTVPLKFSRYLFLLILPASFFTYYAGRKLILYFKKQNQKRIITIVIFLLVASTIFITGMFAAFKSPTYSEDLELAQTIQNNISYYGAENCTFISNNWPLLLDNEIQAYPFSKKELLQHAVNEGFGALFFTTSNEPTYAKNITFLKSLQNTSERVFRSKYSLILPDKCIAQPKFTQTYLEKISTEVYMMHNYNLATDPCRSIFHDSESLEKSCRFINLRGWSLSEIRPIE